MFKNPFKWFGIKTNQKQSKRQLPPGFNDNVLALDSGHKVTGKLKIKLLDSNGKLKEEFIVNNLVVTKGKEFIAACMEAAGPTNGLMSHMAMGIGTTAAIIGDEDLENYNGGARVALDSIIVALAVITYSTTFGPGVNTGALTEAGIFNDPSIATGEMLCRTVFPVVNKAAGDTMIINWNITIA